MKIKMKLWKFGRSVISCLLICTLFLLCCQSHVRAEEEVPPELANLYAQSAVLLDGDSGRVLYGKGELEQKPMASTTKIMTCIVALEQGELSSVVTASEEACRQPKVHLGMRKDEQFYLKDLLYSLMLESHNDSAVAIAEHVAGSVPAFAQMMNEKAKELGCEDTYFITPNGLDAEDERGVHSTTAVDLARIMKYCVVDSPKKAEFMGITGTEAHQFTDVTGARVFSCNNHNAFLKMMDGAFSGKTGFTADAGYCYVGALKRDGKTMIVALLACGWPNNKSYKWSDTRKMMQYGLDAYEPAEVWREVDLDLIEVENGIPASGRLYENAQMEVAVQAEDADSKRKVLLHRDEELTVEIECLKKLEAPVRSGLQVGSITYSVGDDVIAVYPLITKSDIEAKGFIWCLRKTIDLWLKLV